MQREMKITGEGRLSLKPDIMLITLPVTASSINYKDSIELLNERVITIHKILSKNKIDKDKLKTTDFRVTEDWERTKKNKNSTFKGFIAQHELILEIPLINELVSSILVDISKSEIGISFSIRFDVSKKETYNKQLIKNAVIDATESAKIIAETSGIKLKEIIHIDYSFSEITFQDDNVMYESEMMYSNSIMPELSPDEIQAKKNITIVWRIE